MTESVCVVEFPTEANQLCRSMFLWVHSLCCSCCHWIVLQPVPGSHKVHVGLEYQMSGRQAMLETLHTMYCTLTAAGKFLNVLSYELISPNSKLYFKGLYVVFMVTIWTRESLLGPPLAFTPCYYWWESYTFCWPRAERAHVSEVEIYAETAPGK